MPDLVSIAIGGGTIVAADRPGALGPRSVGYRLHQEALVFGGAPPRSRTPPSLAGRPSIGDAGPTAATSTWSPRLGRADAMRADAIDRVKTSRRTVPLIAVGGGSILIPDTIPGVSEVHPAGALRRGQCHRRGDRRRSAGSSTGLSTSAPTAARPRSTRRPVGPASEAVAARARTRARCEVVEMEEIPLAYLTDPAVARSG